MNILKKYDFFTIYDLDEEMKEFLEFLNKMGHKHLAEAEVLKDLDGCYKAPSGFYVDIFDDHFYLSAADLLKCWIYAKERKDPNAKETDRKAD